MKQATLAEAERGLGELIARVRAGESIEITDGGETVARLVPAGDEVRAAAESGAAHSREMLARRIAQMEREGRIAPSQGRKVDLLQLAPAEGEGSAMLLEALLEERREGR